MQERGIPEHAVCSCLSKNACASDKTTRFKSSLMSVYINVYIIISNGILIMLLWFHGLSYP